MPNSRAGFAAFLAMTALGWGYYVLIIFAASLASTAFLDRPLLAPEHEIYHALFLGTFHGIPAAATGILALLAASRLSPNRPALPLVAATSAGACVILVSFFPPFLAYEELNLTGSAILRYATEAVERVHWWSRLLLAGVQVQFLAGCWWWLKPANPVEDAVRSRP